MSLSSGTLNLKFMQRAAARSGAPVAPATPTTPEVADANKWVLPRKGNAEAGPSKPRVQFVSSYMPFLEADEAEGAEGGDGGRRSFGGFGKKEEVVEEDEEMDYESDGGRKRVKTDDIEINVKPAKVGKVEKAEKRSFQRPSGFDSPKSNGSGGDRSGSKPKSQADKLRATISGMKSVSMSPASSKDGGATPSPAPSDKETGKKDKKRPHPSTGESTPKRVKVEGKKGKSTALDEREKALKAAKKAEKKAKRKA